ENLANIEPKLANSEALISKAAAELEKISKIPNEIANVKSEMTQAVKKIEAQGQQLQGLEERLKTTIGTSIAEFNTPEFRTVLVRGVLEKPDSREEMMGGTQFTFVRPELLRSFELSGKKLSTRGAELRGTKPLSLQSLHTLIVDAEINQE